MGEKSNIRRDKGYECLKSVLNPFPNKPWFLCVYILCLLKTLLEMEKLLHSLVYILIDCLYGAFKMN